MKPTHCLRITTSLAALVLLEACRPASPVTVESAWSPPTPPGAATAAVYMQISVREADVLLSAATPIAQLAQIHETSLGDGMMRMRPLERLALAAGETVRFEPGGRHFMLMNAQQPPAGASFPMTLRFANAGEIKIVVAVRAAGE